ncbi:MAG: hypothetical protein U0269_11670 [Polyangiales bacterium]
MREFSETMGFETARDSTQYTASVLDASGVHEKQAKAMKAQLTKWDAIELARRAAVDGVTKANARVAWCDYELDASVKRFANELLRDANGNRDEKTFRTFFAEAPNEVIRLGLENEIELCEAMIATGAKVKVSKTASEALTAIKAKVAAGKKALDERKAAYAAQASVSLDMTAWKQATNAARVSVYVGLQSWAVEHGEDRSYAERFFPEGPKRSAKGKQPGEGPGGGGA